MNRKLHPALKDVPFNVRCAAELQMSLWLDRTVRIATGVQHFRDPVVRRGQWVRFIGNPSVVQTPDMRPPGRGEYGQVLWRMHPRGPLTVVFLRSKTFANLRPEDVEPLVGTPIGRPRDHLRRFKQGMKARERALQRADELQAATDSR